MSRAVGIDVGGTFTDFVVVDDGVVSVFKHLTTPADPSVGVLDGMVRFAKRERIPFPDIARIIHGTTLVANCLIERRGARTALITTVGFRDVLEIGREARYDLYDLDLERPEPLIPRPLRFEIGERVLADGTELEPLDGADAVSPPGGRVRHPSCRVGSCGRGERGGLFRSPPWSRQPDLF